MSRSDRRGAPQPRETSQQSISNSSPSGEDVAQRQKGGAANQRDTTKSPPKDPHQPKNHKKLAFSRRSAHKPSNPPQPNGKGPKQNSTPHPTPPPGPPPPPQKRRTCLKNSGLKKRVSPSSSS